MLVHATAASAQLENVNDVHTSRMSACKLYAHTTRYTGNLLVPFITSKRWMFTKGFIIIYTL